MKKKVPKYQEISDWLRKGIVSGRCKPGARLTSEPSLCEAFGVSRQTARSAIAILEKEGLVVRRQGSGTYVSHFLSGAGRKKIGLLLTCADDYIFPAMISGIEEILSKQGHRMSLSLTQNKVETERSQMLTLLSDSIDGLIVEAVKSALPSPNLALYRELAARGMSVACETDICGGFSEYIGACVTGEAATLLDINNTVPADMHAEEIVGRYPYTLQDVFMGFHCGNTPCDRLTQGAIKHQADHAPPA